MGRTSAHKAIYPRTLLIRTGTFTGDAGATQAVTGVGFTPIRVEIHQQSDNQFRYQYIKTDQDSTYTIINEFNTVKTLYKEDVIISLDTDGFTVGDSENMNANNIVHAYTCYGYAAPEAV